MNASDQVLVASTDGGHSASIASIRRQVAASRSTATHEPLSRLTVVRHAAATVWKCISDSPHGQWILPDGTVVTYEDLVLLELVKVAKAAHQIVLGYFKPAPVWPTASVGAVAQPVLQGVTPFMTNNRTTYPIRIHDAAVDSTLGLARLHLSESASNAAREQGRMLEHWGSSEGLGSPDYSLGNDRVCRPVTRACTRQTYMNRHESSQHGSPLQNQLLLWF